MHQRTARRRGPDFRLVPGAVFPKEPVVQPRPRPFAHHLGRVSVVVCAIALSGGCSGDDPPDGTGAQAASSGSTVDAGDGIANSPTTSPGEGGAPDGPTDSTVPGDAPTASGLEVDQDFVDFIARALAERGHHVDPAALASLLDATCQRIAEGAPAGSSAAAIADDIRATATADPLPDLPAEVAIGAVRSFLEIGGCGDASIASDVADELATP